ncbi:MAG: prefoldin subunit alpha [Nitrososphaerales archaeon]|uniref:Prefoldin subunit alpha n=1 Tax=uncultured marine thaumarchaeote AD1000_70_G10 TaxID=1455934 RepID=A0A075G201_9ARCH|nr:prefoldin, alpha subunit (pfdA, PFDN5) [uncultured marine thaumarchaeote AD1000_70_G10]MCH2380627.1 prefoldin subunit alpha [Nitrososphaerales archaeon]
MNVDQQTQVLLQQMKQLESYLTDIGNRENMAMNAIVESRAAVRATEILNNTSAEEILFPIGSGLLTKIGDKSTFFVNIGAGVTIEKNEEEVKEFLNERIKDIEKSIQALSTQKQDMAQQYNSIRAALNNIVQGQQDVRQS